MRCLLLLCTVVWGAAPTSTSADLLSDARKVGKRIVDDELAESYLSNLIAYELIFVTGQERRYRGFILSQVHAAESCLLRLKAFEYTEAEHPEEFRRKLQPLLDESGLTEESCCRCIICA